MKRHGGASSRDRELRSPFGIDIGRLARVDEPLPPRGTTIDAHAVVNPILLVEVTSRSTEDYDRGDKLEAYKNIESLRTILIVSHRERRITVADRTATGWSSHDVTSGAHVRIDAPALSFAIDDVFAGIALDAP